MEVIPIALLVDLEIKESDQGEWIIDIFLFCAAIDFYGRFCFNMLTQFLASSSLINS